jgi:hypothetical protein
MSRPPEVGRMAWVSTPIIAIVLAAVSAVVAMRRRRRVRLPARAVIVSPRRSTVVNEQGAVRSVHTAEVTVQTRDLDALWNATTLERLARTYWLFLSRVTLGLCRVVYGQDDRAVVLVFRPIKLLRFGPPEYDLESDHGCVRWKIRDGLLVARAGRGSGYLSLDVQRFEDGADGWTKVRIEVEVANFYPAIAAGFRMPIYKGTQSYIHVLVTHAFLRSLAKLDLAVSKVGRFETPETESDPETQPAQEPTARP